MSTASLDPRTARGVTDVLNVTFRLLRARWALFGKAILYFGAPFFVLGMGLLFIGIVAGAVLAETAISPGPGAVAGAGLGILAGIGLLLVGGALAITGIVAVVQLHVDTDTDEIALQAVWQRTKAHVWGVLGVQFLHVLALLVLAPIAVIPCLGALLWIGGAVFLTIRYFYLAVPVRVLEDTSVGGAISRAGTLVEDAFWQTAGVFLLVYVAQLILSTSITLPIQLFLAGGALHTLDIEALPAWIGAVAIGIVLLMVAVSVLGYGIMYGAATVQAYALIDQREGTSVEEDVAQLEQAVDQTDADTDDASTDQDRRNP